MPASESLRVNGALALLILIWGSTWAAIRLGLEGLPPFTGVALRFGLASLLLFGLGLALRVPFQWGRRLVTLWAVETVFAFCISYGIVYWAEQRVPSGLAAILFSTFPLFVAVLAHFWLDGEPITGHSALGILLGFAGVAVIFSDDLDALAGPGVLTAALVFLGSPPAAAISHVLVKKWGRGLHPLNLATVPMAATGVLMGGLAALVEAERSFVFDAVSVGALLYLACFGSAMTFTLYYWVLERIPATRVSLITFGIPLVAVLIGTLFLDEPLTGRTLLGGALVIGGVTLAGRRPRRRGPTPAA